MVGGEAGRGRIRERYHWVICLNSKEPEGAVRNLLDFGDRFEAEETLLA